MYTYTNYTYVYIALRSLADSCHGILIRPCCWSYSHVNGDFRTRMGCHIEPHPRECGGGGRYHSIIFATAKQFSLCCRSESLWYLSRVPNLSSTLDSVSCFGCRRLASCPTLSNRVSDSFWPRHFLQLNVLLLGSTFTQRVKDIIRNHEELVRIWQRPLRPEESTKWRLLFAMLIRYRNGFSHCCVPGK